MLRPVFSPSPSKGWGRWVTRKRCPSLSHYCIMLPSRQSPYDIAIALGDLHDKQALPALFPLLTDPNVETRKAALHSLTMFRDASALNPIASLLNDQDEGTRTAAADALGFIPVMPPRTACWRFFKNRESRQAQGSRHSRVGAFACRKIPAANFFQYLAAVVSAITHQSTSH